MKHLLQNLTLASARNPLLQVIWFWTAGPAHWWWCWKIHAAEQRAYLARAIPWDTHPFPLKWVGCRKCGLAAQVRMNVRDAARYDQTGRYRFTCARCAAKRISRNARFFHRFEVILKVVRLDQ